ncbi:hypothetical protein RQP46_009291 [Phenoliferia psychrophenolica]
MNWWNAFTPWTGAEGEPPLLEELGINFDHIIQKSLTVLNPLSAVEPHIMDDADLAGPLVFCFVFASLLLLSGRPQFSYIYGVALVGSGSIYCLLNLMSESGIDAYRTASVLGYCLLPLVLLSIFGVVVSLDGTLGYLLSALSIAWCSYSASSIFSSVLRLSSQRFLVAYPVGLLYAAFALLSVFDGKTGGIGAKRMPPEYPATLCEAVLQLDVLFVLFHLQTLPPHASELTSAIEAALSPPPPAPGNPASSPPSPTAARESHLRAFILRVLLLLLARSDPHLLPLASTSNAHDRAMSDPWDDVALRILGESREGPEWDDARTALASAVDEALEDWLRTKDLDVKQAVASEDAKMEVDIGGAEVELRLEIKPAPAKMEQVDSTATASTPRLTSPPPSDSTESPSLRVFVRDLAFSVKSETLLACFQAYNPTAAFVCSRESSGGSSKSKGFGFVEFGDERDRVASLGLSGFELEGRRIEVQIARDRGSSATVTDSTTANPLTPSSSSSPDRSIVVSNLSPETTSDKLRQIFTTQVGPVASVVRISSNDESWTANVTFADSHVQVVAKAIELLDGTRLAQRHISVRAGIDLKTFPLKKEAEAPDPRTRPTTVEAAAKPERRTSGDGKVLQAGSQKSPQASVSQPEVLKSRFRAPADNGWDGWAGRVRASSPPRRTPPDDDRFAPTHLPPLHSSYNIPPHMSLIDDRENRPTLFIGGLPGLMDEDRLQRRLRDTLATVIARRDILFIKIRAEPGLNSQYAFVHLHPSADKDRVIRELDRTYPFGREHYLRAGSNPTSRPPHHETNLLGIRHEILWNVLDSALVLSSLPNSSYSRQITLTTTVAWQQTAMRGSERDLDDSVSPFANEARRQPSQYQAFQASDTRRQTYL